jgi:hypothetical protein
MSDRYLQLFALYAIDGVLTVSPKNLYVYNARFTVVSIVRQHSRTGAIHEVRFTRGGS